MYLAWSWLSSIWPNFNYNLIRTTLELKQPQRGVICKANTYKPGAKYLIVFFNKLIIVF